jgi:ribosomal protein S18 acetylase RimI-like enzyme
VKSAVRRANEADAETLSLLNADVQSLHAAAMPERFKQHGPDTFPATIARAILAKPSNLVFIAEVDSEAIGYAYAEIIHLPESSLLHAWNEVHLHHISVRPSYRRKGVANALLDSVRAAANELGIDPVTLQVWNFNEDARGFFQQRGFTPYMVRLWDRQAITLPATRSGSA